MSVHNYVHQVLADVYTPEGVEIWLRSCNRNLDGRSPLELLAEGRPDLVIAEAERTAGGMG